MIEKEYRFNARFRRYVDQYAEEHKITVKEALTHDDVKRAWMQYTEV